MGEVRFDGGREEPLKRPGKPPDVDHFGETLFGFAPLHQEASRGKERGEITEVRREPPLPFGDREILHHHQLEGIGRHERHGHRPLPPVGATSDRMKFFPAELRKDERDDEREHDRSDMGRAKQIKRGLLY